MSLMQEIQNIEGEGGLPRNAPAPKTKRTRQNSFSIHNEEDEEGAGNPFSDANTVRAAKGKARLGRREAVKRVESEEDVVQEEDPNTMHCGGCAKAMKRVANDFIRMHACQNLHVACSEACLKNGCAKCRCFGCGQTAREAMLRLACGCLLCPDCFQRIGVGYLYDLKGCAHCDTTAVIKANSAREMSAGAFSTVFGKSASSRQKKGSVVGKRDCEDYAFLSKEKVVSKGFGPDRIRDLPFYNAMSFVYSDMTNDDLQRLGFSVEFLRNKGFDFADALYLAKEEAARLDQYDPETGKKIIFEIIPGILERWSPSLATLFSACRVVFEVDVDKEGEWRKRVLYCIKDKLFLNWEDIAENCNDSSWSDILTLADGKTWIEVFGDDVTKTLGNSIEANHARLADAALSNQTDARVGSKKGPKSSKRKARSKAAPDTGL